MNGAAVTKNIRRQGIPATIKGKPNPEYPSIEIHGSPTAERLRKAGDNFALGGEDRGVRTYVMRDTPLDRALRRGLLTGAQHSALEKFRHHWFHGGSAPSVGSVDLNRIFAADTAGMTGMPKSERQEFHRARYREAVGEIGLRASSVVENVVCYEHPLDDAGMKLGWSSAYRAREGAKELLVGAAAKLTKLWGIG